MAIVFGKFEEHEEAKGSNPVECSNLGSWLRLPGSNGATV